MSTPKAEDQPMKLTVAVLARGHQPEVLDTLRCASEIADELLLVCSEVSDEILAGARACSARSVEMAWEDDYSAAKNFGLDEARGEWVLWLEPGEALDQDKIAALSSFVDTTANRASAYQLFVQAPWTIESPVQEQVAQVRLLPRRPGLKFAGRVNESVAESLQRLGMTVEALDCLIKQSPAGANMEKIQNDWRDRLRIAEEEMAGGGNSPAVLLTAGMAHSLLGRFDEADRCFRQVLQLGKPKSSETLDAYFGILTIQDQDPDRAGRQIETCLNALEMYPLDAQLLCGLGTYMLRQGRLDLAARSFRVALEHGRIDPATWHVADIKDVAACCLSLTLQSQDDSREAQRVLEKALSERPEASRVRRQLLDLHVRLNNQEAALATFDLLPKDLPHRDALRTAVRGGVLAAQRSWSSAEPYLVSAYTAGCRDALCLRWLSITYLSLDRAEDAAPLLKEWQEVEPYSLEPKALLERLQAIPEDRSRRSSTAAPEPSGALERDSRAIPLDGRQIRIDTSPNRDSPEWSPTPQTPAARSPLDPPPSASV